MKNIFIIHTEHQYIQVEEAIKHFQMDKNNLMVIFIVLNSKSWAGKIIETYQLVHYNIFISWTFTDLIKKRNIPLHFISFLKEIKKDNIEKLFFSQYKNDSSRLAFTILKPQNTFLMDEGTASFRFLEMRKEEKKTIIKTKIKYFLKSLLYQNDIITPEKIIYFTQYEIKPIYPDEVIKYYFSKKCYISTINKNNVFILGSSIAEIGIVQEEYFFKIINEIKLLHHDKNIIYYAHRKENEKKLKKVEELGIKIIENKQPFENLYGELVEIPVVLYSFYSPVVPNLSLMYENLPSLKIINLESSKILKNHKIIEEVYNNYSFYKNIEIVNF